MTTLEAADRLKKILDGKGYKTGMYERDKQFVVAVFGVEGQDREIRNAIPMFYWFWHWLHAQTIHEPEGKIIVEFS